MLIRSDTNRRGINWFDVWSTQSGGKLSGSNSADVLPHFLRQPDLSRLHYTKVGKALVTVPASRELRKYSNIKLRYKGMEPKPASTEFPNIHFTTVSCCHSIHNLLLNSYFTLSFEYNNTVGKDAQPTCGGTKLTIVTLVKKNYYFVYYKSINIFTRILLETYLYKYYN